MRETDALPGPLPPPPKTPNSYQHIPACLWAVLHGSRRCFFPAVPLAAACRPPLCSGIHPVPASHHLSHPWSSPTLWHAQCSCHCKDRRDHAVGDGLMSQSVCLNHSWCPPMGRLASSPNIHLTARWLQVKVQLSWSFTCFLTDLKTDDWAHVGTSFCDCSNQRYWSFWVKLRGDRASSVEALTLFICSHLLLTDVSRNVHQCGNSAWKENLDRGIWTQASWVTSS